MNRISKLSSLIVISAAFALAQFPAVQNPNPNPGPIFPSSQASPQIVDVYTINSALATVASFNLTCTPNSFNGVANQNNNQITLPAGVQCPAGLYRISTSMIAASNGGGTFTPATTYHQAATTQTITGSAITVSTGNVLVDTATFQSDGTAQITLSLTLSGTGTINGVVVLERLN